MKKLFSCFFLPYTPLLFLPTRNTVAWRVPEAQPVDKDVGDNRVGKHNKPKKKRKIEEKHAITIQDLYLDLKSPR